MFFFLLLHPHLIHPFSALSPFLSLTISASFPYYNPLMTDISHSSHSVGHRYYFLNLSLSSLPITLYFISQHLTLITSAAQSRPHVTGNLIVDRFENPILLS